MIVQQEIRNMKNDRIGIDAFVIMPNHVHMIITIREHDTVETSIYGVSGAWYENWHAINLPAVGRSRLYGEKCYVQ